MKLILITFSILAVLLIIPTSTTIASFASPNATLPEKGTIPDDPGVYQGTNFVDAVELIITWVLGFIGIIVFVIFLYAGFEYATAGGDETKTKTAQARMANAIIGLLILFFAFVASNAILSFVFQTNNNTNTNNSPNQNNNNRPNQNNNNNNTPRNNSNNTNRNNQPN